MSPAQEKILSDGTDVAGIPSSWRATCATRGKRPSFFFHHASGVASSSEGSCRYRRSSSLAVLVVLGTMKLRRDQCCGNRRQTVNDYIGSGVRSNGITIYALTRKCAVHVKLVLTVGKAVRRRAPQNLRQLEQFVMEEWNRVSQATCRNYVLSMRSRCRAVIQANGGHTKY
ncbi:hypothetical protein MAR_005941 [Mya arenaria]|uniref:Uncharacterized protein n=1 Tax=Mya arenaria TaxID=6604 RepID=A0ABY7DEK8_MYAAR|nr:hypothetical protein MAR_005941 [Mya arenaria]